MTAFYYAASPAARAIRKAEGSRGVRTRDHHAPGRENRTKEAAIASLARMKAEAELAVLTRLDASAARSMSASLRKRPKCCVAAN